jgi:NAD+ kinase
MKQKRVLLLLKRTMLDIYKARERLQISESGGYVSPILSHPQMMGNLLDRHMAHENSVQFCKDVLEQKTNVQLCLREELISPIRGVDLVVTIGGDGTLLQASHYLDDSIPVPGVNSDPTKSFEVEEKVEWFDASRSTGHLCATTAETFKQVLPTTLLPSRMFTGNYAGELPKTEWYPS